MDINQVILITGTRKGIGKYLVDYYTGKGVQVIGCSRGTVDYDLENYRHFCLDVSDEGKVKKMFAEIRRTYGRLDVLINNAGFVLMNHFILTTLSAVQETLNTNVIGSFLFCREAAKLMKKNKYGRIVNFTTVAVPLKIPGEAIYASSKAAIISLTQILAKELADYGITINAIGPTPIGSTDFVTHIATQEIINNVVQNQAIKRLGEFRDITNVIDFFIRPESDFVSGQVLFLGGV